MSNLVSVIIPTLNEEKNIASCLLSVKNQTYKNTEIILVDNFSKDSTLEIAKGFGVRIFKAGTERSAQRNFGSRKSKGTWLLFMDADMELTPNVIKNATVTASKNKFDAIIIPEKVKGDNFWAKCLNLEKKLYMNQPSILAARFFEKQKFLKLGGYDEDLIAGEDWDLHVRSQKAGIKIGMSKSVIYNNESNMNLLEILKKKFYYAKNIKIYAKKHPKEFLSQANFVSRLITRPALTGMAKDPAHAAGLIFLKSAQAFTALAAQF
ncbi:hypothetical protein A3D81_00605 [Candidatus Curtissbacteria bacterium RIFCSPHIGHO2_02_FULL_40_17]|uniref:Glycosyltransferase 2-like domain-containing protein n=3 Tax=Candidatus Curtissiibacteriota TaxID=1752717 RepID=A0A1F5GI88_9BACT|nr:MAG: hypothetical protein A3D81_00605 [Candidatus Curtissbacteria bacterium RIFCSPHIGHO2_02_FULL_40_17]OGE03437.1 MAG: hypothetical protein A3F45_04365 [Candidatus Curtissbacteria bacterium RIFCSPHIGHO2_12_FULL_41_17]OGE07900.1 MAG: hypothetical protein A3I53_04450 [Candidatus Curtissbacteria bacterium RIFCSPLOWO2_02_FULL_40_13b]